MFRGRRLEPLGVSGRRAPDRLSARKTERCCGSLGGGLQRRLTVRPANVTGRERLKVEESGLERGPYNCCPAFGRRHGRRPGLMRPPSGLVFRRKKKPPVPAAHNLCDAAQFLGIAVGRLAVAQQQLKRIAGNESCRAGNIGHRTGGGLGHNLRVRCVHACAARSQKDQDQRKRADNDAKSHVSAPQVPARFRARSTHSLPHHKLRGTQWVPSSLWYRSSFGRKYWQARLPNSSARPAGRRKVRASQSRVRQDYKSPRTPNGCTRRGTGLARRRQGPGSWPARGSLRASEAPCRSIRVRSRPAASSGRTRAPAGHRGAGL